MSKVTFMLLVAIFLISGCSFSLVNHSRSMTVKDLQDKSFDETEVRIVSYCANESKSKFFMEDLSGIESFRSIVEKYIDQKKIKYLKMKNQRVMFLSRENFMKSLIPNSRSKVINYILECRPKEGLGSLYGYSMASAMTFSIIGITPFFRDFKTTVTYSVFKDKKISREERLEVDSREWKWIGLGFSKRSDFVTLDGIPAVSKSSSFKAFLNSFELAVQESLNY